MLYNGKDIATIPDNLTFRGVKNVINRVCEITTRFVNQQTKIVSLFVKRIEDPLDEIDLGRRNNRSLSLHVNISALYAKPAIGMNHPGITLPKTKLTLIFVKEFH